MVPTASELVRAIESTFALFSDLPGYTTPLQIRGVSARMTALSHPLANVVSNAALSEGAAAGVVRQVHRAYADAGKAYGWVVGPLTRPPDLGAHLTEAGLHKAFTMAGMVLTDLAVPIRANPAVRILDLAPAEAAPYSEMVAQAYGLPRDVSDLIIGCMAAVDPYIRYRLYVAFVAGSDAPVAFGAAGYLTGTPIIILGGAATLGDQRGKGVYTSLVARRLADARANGATAAVIQAVRETSAPICARLGFQEICNLDFWAWAPGGQETGN